MSLEDPKWFDRTVKAGKHVVHALYCYDAQGVRRILLAPLCGKGTSHASRIPSKVTCVECRRILHVRRR